MKKTMKVFEIWLVTLAISVLGVLGQNVPQQIGVSGRVVVDGELITGSGFFKFAIVDAESQSVNWYHDGTDVGQGEPESALALIVTEGRFSVGLGDMDLGMQPISPSLLARGPAAIKTWFSDSYEGPFEVLEPTLSFDSVPYAHLAGAVDEDAIDRYVAERTQRLNMRHLFVGANREDAAANSRVHIRGKLIVAEGGADFEQGGGILELRSHGAGSRYFQQMVTDASVPASLRSALVTQVGDDRGWLPLSILRASGWEVRVPMTIVSDLTVGQALGDGRLVQNFSRDRTPFSLRRDRSDDERLSFYVGDTISHFKYHNNDHRGRIRFTIENSSTSGVPGTDFPANSLDVLELEADHNGGRMLVNGLLYAMKGIRYADGTVQTSASQGGGAPASSLWRQSDGSIYYDAGRVGISRDDAPTKLAIHSSVDDFNKSREAQLLLSYGGVNDGIGFVVNDAFGSGNGALTLQRRSASDGGFKGTHMRMDVDSGNTEFYGEVTVKVLHIKGGADVAELFEAREGNDPKPGMLATIDLDSANPSSVTATSMAYDQRVIGVVSGAGGVEPGIIMSQDGSTAEGDLPIAMKGRVNVWCSADENGPIGKGDALVSSRIPGTAMKASGDYSELAVVGFALEDLPSRSGHVLMWVK